MKRLLSIASLAVVFSLAGLACTPDSSIREVGVRNNCSTDVEVSIASSAANIKSSGIVIGPGETRGVRGFGDLSTVHARWGVPGVELDDSLPVVTYEPEDLVVANPEEENENGVEFYFIVEGSDCP